MAVLEHAVHERTREKAGATWGCHNRPDFKDGYYAPDRIYSEDGRFESVLTWVPHFGSRECRNDHSLVDAKCNGCPHRGTGEAYTRMVQAKGNA